MSEEVEAEDLGAAGLRIAEHLHAAGLQLHQARNLLLDVRPGPHEIAEKHVAAALQAVDEALLHSGALSVEISRQASQG